ncbi:DUF1349 domain-containing protein [Sorangium sp. So ce367]|uniref:DUF1349 domain-containing protein n=1 Tax=Sorangium sp. So ce367 TaxID=3133305 RepID=UPI003F5F80E4
MVYCLHHAERNRRLLLLFFLAAGLSGVTAASLFGLAMHRAIAPRIRRMVTAVQRFLQGSPGSTARDSGSSRNPPARWAVEPERSVLVVEPSAKTDYWQRTHYGFRNDNGPFLFTRAGGDFVMTCHVRFRPAHQYDQAGLMVRIAESCWLKTSVEFEPDGPSRLGPGADRSAGRAAQRIVHGSGNGGGGRRVGRGE